MTESDPHIVLVETLVPEPDAVEPVLVLARQPVAANVEGLDGGEAAVDAEGTAGPQVEGAGAGPPRDPYTGPAWRRPPNGTPSAAMPAIAGSTISGITRAWTFGVTTGAGEYAPIPPVLGPRSPSSRR